MCFCFYRFPSLRSRTHASTEYTPHTAGMGTQLPSPAPLLPPPSALLHPTLMEKMRLNSPTSAHMHLNTLNRQQTENEINETLYGLQEAAPFPKLPPYFVHRPEGESTQDESVARSSMLRSAPVGAGRRDNDAATHSRRPPSGKSSASIITPSESSDRITVEASQNRSKGEHTTGILYTLRPYGALCSNAGGAATYKGVAYTI